MSVEKPTPGLYSCSFPHGCLDISISTLRKYGLVVHVNTLNSKVNGNLRVNVGYRIAQATGLFLRCGEYFFFSVKIFSPLPVLYAEMIINKSYVG